MGKRWLKRFAGVAFAVLLSIELFAFISPKAGAVDTGWMGASPTVSSGTDIPSTDLFASRPCDNITTNVNSFYTDFTTHLVRSYQNECVVSTTSGLMDSNGEYIQPNGYSEMYRLVNNAPGVKVITPLPNQDGAIAYTNSSYSGALTLNFYRNLYNHTHLNILRKSFDMTDQADFTPKFADGNPFPVYPTTLTHSKNGRYVVIYAFGVGYMRIDMDTQEIKPFGNISGNFTAIDDSGRYAAITLASGGTQSYVKIVDIEGCTVAQLPATLGSAANVNCPTKDIYPGIKSSLPTGGQIVALRFSNDHVLQMDVKYGTNQYKRYSAAAAGTQLSLSDYLALGDSYISGEGAFSYREGTDMDINKCHQSLFSYPYLLGANFSSSSSVACSGARMRNIVGNPKDTDTYQLTTHVIPTDDQRSAAAGKHLPGYFPQNAFVALDNPSAMTLSIGGNDIGFSNIIKRCIIPFNNGSSTAQNCYETYEDRKEVLNLIDNQFDSLVNLYGNIKKNRADGRLYVIGYPQVISPYGDCQVNVRMSQSDRVFAWQLEDYLNSVIQRAAQRAGVYYVDTSHAFDGHRLCDDSKQIAVNGLTAGDDTKGVLGNESFHPNQYGHQLLADTIAAATHNLTAPMPAADASVAKPAAADSLLILQAPKTNRTIYNILNAAEDVGYFAPANATVQLTEINYKAALAGVTSLQVWMHSSPINLGSIPVLSNGTIDALIKIPANLSAGFHTIHLQGFNNLGTAVDLQYPIYVAASNQDYDGDGILNGADSCSKLPNSGKDSDKDGIDDVCDSQWNEPKPSPESGTGATNGTPTTDSSTTLEQQATSTILQSGPAQNEGVRMALVDETGRVLSDMVGGIPADTTKDVVGADKVAGNLNESRRFGGIVTYVIVGAALLFALFYIGRRLRNDNR